MLRILERKLHSLSHIFQIFVKWLLIAGCTGVLGGLVGSLFHRAIDYATDVRGTHPWLIWLLPAAGLLIVLLYHACRVPQSHDTNLILRSVRSDEAVPVLLAPLIFVGTVLTHLFGGSAGREGAALQLGGSIGAKLGRILKLDEKDMHLATLCGMSSVFSALFGTPLTATFFAMEVISVGIMHYSGFIPCICSSLIAYGISLLFGIAPVRFPISEIPALGIFSVLRVGGLAILCAGISVLFCLLMHWTARLLKRWIPNEYLRIAIGGAALVLLTFLVRSYDYNGAGTDVIVRAMNGDAHWEAFLLKMIFTALTIGAGFKGGEIVPTFFIGATFGCMAGGLLGLPPSFGAAIGLASLFCGVVNCPVASIVLSVELFGAEGLILFAVACGISYMLSGYYGLYSGQKIMYSKLKAEFINKNAK